MSPNSGDSVGRRNLAPLMILLVLILLGYALRIHNLEAFSFWTDEGLTPERSGYPIMQILRNDILIQGVVTKDTHPPLYYLIIHATRQLFGATDFAFRYPSVLFGVLLIPFLYQFGRRLADLTLGLIVAVLATVNPLQVYYSQEARMYTLLALLATAMSYVLWRAMQTVTQRTEQTPPDSPSTAAHRRRTLIYYLLLYGLLAALAFYTHYTVAFLIAAQGLFWAWVLWRGGLRWVIVAAVVIGLLAAIPLVPYTVPRLFSGAEANYYYVPPQVMLQDVVRFFNAGLTSDFSRAFVRAFNLLALGLLLLGLWAARPWHKRLYLLAWLLAVVLGLMAGSLLLKPMYQGVRHIMAGSPAFLLLVAFGIWAIWEWLPASWRDAPDPAESEELTGWAAWVAEAPRFNPLALIPLILLLLGAAVALVNLYTNPAYAKDDFRGIVRYIETRAGDRDIIVYNNAVLLPLHEHYRSRPDIAVTALPVYPQFATGEEPELAALARDYARVWFITDPPADKRDEDSLILGRLEAQLRQVTNRLFPARTTEARVIGYATDADGHPVQPLSVEWPGLPRLTGVAVMSTQPLALPTLWVDLLWEGSAPGDATPLVFTLTGADGQVWVSQARPLVGREHAWEPGINRRSYDLPLPPGLPPGVYTLAVAPEGMSNEVIGEIDVAPTSAWPVAPEQLFGRDELAPLAGGPAAVWPSGLALAAVVPWDDSVLPGNNLPLTVFWRTGPEGIDLTDVRYRLDVIAPDGTVYRSQEARPGASWLGAVPADALLREVTSLYFRPDTPHGTYRLRWTLLDGDAAVGATTEEGQIKVEPWPLVKTLPSAQTVVDAAFGPAIRLHGFDQGAPEDGAWPLTLYWQATAAPETDYLVFLHLVDSATGAIVSQIDTVPAGGTRPTTGWRRDEVITDAHALPIPPDLPPGRYTLNAGLYNPDDGTRPVVTIDGAPQADNQVRLATFDWPGGDQ